MAKQKVTAYQEKILRRIASGDRLHVESRYYNRGTFRSQRMSGAAGTFHERIYERTLNPLVERGFLGRKRIGSPGENEADVFALTELGKSVLGIR